MARPQEAQCPCRTSGCDCKRRGGKWALPTEDKDCTLLSVRKEEQGGWGRCPETQQGLPVPSLAQRLSHFLTQRTRCFTHLTQKHEDASGIHKQLSSSWPDPVRDHSPRPCFSALPGPCRCVRHQMALERQVPTTQEQCHLHEGENNNH